MSGASGKRDPPARSTSTASSINPVKEAEKVQEKWRHPEAKSSPLPSLARTGHRPTSSSQSAGKKPSPMRVVDSAPSPLKKTSSTTGPHPPSPLRRINSAAVGPPPPPPASQAGVGKAAPSPIRRTNSVASAPPQAGVKQVAPSPLRIPPSTTGLPPPPPPPPLRGPGMTRPQSVASPKSAPGKHAHIGPNVSRTYSGSDVVKNRLMLAQGEPNYPASILKGSNSNQGRPESSSVAGVPAVLFVPKQHIPRTESAPAPNNLQPNPRRSDSMSSAGIRVPKAPATSPASARPDPRVLSEKLKSVQGASAFTRQNSTASRLRISTAAPISEAIIEDVGGEEDGEDGLLEFEGDGEAQEGAEGEEGEEEQEEEARPLTDDEKKSIRLQKFINYIRIKTLSKNVRDMYKNKPELEEFHEIYGNGVTVEVKALTLAEREKYKTKCWYRASVTVYKMNENLEVTTEIFHLYLKGGSDWAKCVSSFKAQVKRELSRRGYLREGKYYDKLNARRNHYFNDTKRSQGKA